MHYRHRQTGTFLLAALGVAVLAALVTAVLTGKWAPGGVAAGVLAILAALFSTLRVEVDGEALRLRFGPGPVSRSWPLARVRDAAPVRTSWWWGWGIHLTPRGWLYNVSGLDAVEVRLDDGKSFLIGTDEPRVLAGAIREAAGIPS